MLFGLIQEWPSEEDGDLSITPRVLDEVVYDHHIFELREPKIDFAKVIENG